MINASPAGSIVRAVLLSALFPVFVFAQSEADDLTTLAPDKLYLKAYTLMPNKPAAYRHLIAAAARGHTEARLGLGRWLVSGELDSTKHPVRAMSYFRPHVGKHPWATAGMAQALADAPPPHRDRAQALALALEAEVGWQSPSATFTHREAHALVAQLRAAGPDEAASEDDVAPSTEADDLVRLSPARLNARTSDR